jgi:enolase-phosphatase E1
MPGAFVYSAIARPTRQHCDPVMTIVGLGEQVQTLLLDIEGTTTPLDFVRNLLFPYARSHVRPFLEQRCASEDVRADLSTLYQEHLGDMRAGLNPPPLNYNSPQSRLESMVAYIEWLMARDRKSTPLKSLQGKIWEEGYRSGELLAPVFNDVPAAFQRWQGQGRTMAIFSSGSVLAQRLLFAHTSSGDLTPRISGYFDTTTGPKTDSASYQRIALSLQRRPHEIVFISDTAAELDAAESAGFQVLLCERAGNQPQPPSPYPRIRSFENILP